MKITKKALLLILAGIILVVGVAVTVFLAQQQQDVRQRASEVESKEKAAVFNGTTSVIKIPADSASFSDGKLAIDFFAKLNPSERGDQMLLNTGNESSSPTCSGKLTILASPSNEDHTISVSLKDLDDQSINYSINGASYPIKNGQWAHIALLIGWPSDAGSNSATLAINGVNAGSVALPDNKPFCLNSDVFIGRVNDDPSSDEPFAVNGQIDELRFSKKTYQELVVPTQPSVPDPEDYGLYHLDGDLINEVTNQAAIGSEITFVDAPFPHETTTPVCQANISICSWDPTEGATGYHYKITRSFPNATALTPTPTPIPGESLVVEGDVDAPATSVNFVSVPNATYTCEVSAVSECGTGEPGSATATCVVPTNTPTPTATPTVPVTITLTPTVPPTVPPTIPPTVPPTVPPTIPPTVPPTIPPTTAVVPPTAVPTTPPIAYVPGQPTFTPTPTIVSPGSPLQTLTIIGGALLTILGAIFFFAL